MVDVANPEMHWLQAIFLTVSQPSAMSAFSGPILETHATKNRYRRFSSRICRPLCHFAIRALRTAIRGFPDGTIQKPGLNVQSHALR
jgi:hypothetical protein